MPTGAAVERATTRMCIRQKITANVPPRLHISHHRRRTQPPHNSHNAPFPYLCETAVSKQSPEGHFVFAMSLWVSVPAAVPAGAGAKLTSSRCITDVVDAPATARHNVIHAHFTSSRISSSCSVATTRMSCVAGSFVAWGQQHGVGDVCMRIQRGDVSGVVAHDLYHANGPSNEALSPSPHVEPPPLCRAHCIAPPPSPPLHGHVSGGHTQSATLAATAAAATASVPVPASAPTPATMASAAAAAAPPLPRTRYFLIEVSKDGWCGWVSLAVAYSQAITAMGMRPDNTATLAHGCGTNAQLVARALCRMVADWCHPDLLDTSILGPVTPHGAHESCMQYILSDDGDDTAVRARLPTRRAFLAEALEKERLAYAGDKCLVRMLKRMTPDTVSALLMRAVATPVGAPATFVTWMTAPFLVILSHILNIAVSVYEEHPEQIKLRPISRFCGFQYDIESARKAVAADAMRQAKRGAAEQEMARAMHAIYDAPMRTVSSKPLFLRLLHSGPTRGAPANHYNPIQTWSVYQEILRHSTDAVAAKAKLGDPAFVAPLGKFLKQRAGLGVRQRTRRR